MTKVVIIDKNINLLKCFARVTVRFEVENKININKEIYCAM